MFIAIKSVSSVYSIDSRKDAQNDSTCAPGVYQTGDTRPRTKDVLCNIIKCTLISDRSSSFVWCSTNYSNLFAEYHTCLIECLMSKKKDLCKVSY